MSFIPPVPFRIRALASGLALSIWLAWTSIAGSGCNADDVDERLGTDYYESRVARGPEKRSRKQPDARCYDSFEKFKKKEGDAGTGMQWHHIVGQHAANERTFGKLDLNCTDNLIRIPRPIHEKVNGYYSSRKDPVAQGKIVRDWLAEQSFDAQYEFGLQVLRDHGIKL